ncbi:MAG: right-handed parallel beta-helix repeat-containing protein [Chloroflexi bacterium]|nr:right-handed parallel beta-helix repeat-containing protein [Chloroflexota bacterium]
MVKIDNIKAAFYVATNGNDTWSGKLKDPNSGGTDGPFATLQRARDAVREMKAQTKDGLKEPVTVMVRGGRYYFEKTLDLREADSGTPQSPVVYTAYPGESPVLSGGMRITGWEPYKGKILKREIQEAKGGNLQFRHLFADGQRQVRARYPKQDPESERWNGKWAVSQADDAALESSEPYIVWNEPDAFPHHWAKPTQGELFLMPRTMWGDSCLIRIKSVDPKKGILHLAHGMRTFAVNPFFVPRKIHHSEFCQFIIENLLEELTSPGEWCLDTEEGMLYFWPPGKSLDNMEVVIPVMKCLVHMEGVSHVHLSGFELTEVNGGEPSSHYPDVDGVGPMRPQMGWDYCGETIYMNRCTGCHIENNRIFNVGGNGIYLRHHNERNRIRHNEISYTGANGVVLAGGRHSLYQGLPFATPGIPHPIFNEITDNTIHHIGLVDPYAAGVFLGLSNWTRVAHNDIRDVPHHAINLGNSRYGRNYIEYNLIHRANQLTADSGAINCWHEMPPDIEPPGHVIRYNFISDTGNAYKSAVASSPYSMGIYLDNWSSNCLVYGNIVVNTLTNGKGVGILVKGRNNIVENNIVVNSGSNHFYACYDLSYDVFATVVSRNIFYDTLPGSRPVFEHLRINVEHVGRDYLCAVFLQCDHNLFFKKGDSDPLMFKDVRFSDWVKRYSGGEDVYDANSIVADPLFVDAAHGDYRLKPESPAFKLGFQQIDATKIGLRTKNAR